MPLLEAALIFSCLSEDSFVFSLCCPPDGFAWEDRPDKYRPFLVVDEHGLLFSRLGEECNKFIFRDPSINSE